MKILFVDHSTDHLQVVQAIERTGASVIHATGPEDARQQFASQRPDLVLIDGTLPEGAAFACARTLRADAPPEAWTPIIFLAAAGQEHALELAIDAGCDDFLNKPVSATILQAKMRSMQRMVLMHASMRALTRQLDSSNRALQRLSSCDGLTGVANRRHFDAMLRQEWRRASRQADSLALLMCDVDHFKAYNDNLGHPAGDECLRWIAAILQQKAARAGDLVARYGGEEFALILPATDLAGAEGLAERIREHLHAQPLSHPASPLGRVTLSMGIALATPSASSEPAWLVQRADCALYQAKQAGRDCTRSILLSDLSPDNQATTQN